MIVQIPKNKREKRVAEEYAAQGFEVLHKGWPDFLVIKDGKIRMIEVKRKQSRSTKKMGLSKHQARMKEILSQHFEYEIRYED
jgi:hypothetical protein